MEERRRFPRYECAFEIKYSTQGNAVIECHTVSKNISRVGIRLPLSRIVKHGDTLNLTIDSNDKKGHVSATGKVVWVKDIMRRAPLELDAGVEFTKQSRSIDSEHNLTDINQTHAIAFPQ